jgi:hypothetical protein
MSIEEEEKNPKKEHTRKKKVNVFFHIVRPQV